MKSDNLAPAICRHGIPLYRYCAPCEEGWQTGEPEPHVTPVGCWLLACALIAAVLVVLAVTRPWEGRA